MYGLKSFFGFCRFHFSMFRFALSSHFYTTTLLDQCAKQQVLLTLVNVKNINLKST